jgi:hypothetical protein
MAERSGQLATTLAYYKTINKIIKFCMKKIISIGTFFLIGSLGVKAQVMQQKAQWVTIKSANLKCWECKERLERYLISENQSNMQGGMLQRKYNLLEGELRIYYLPDRADVELIKATINNAGFDANDELAEEHAYKKLPPACKRAADGGGPQKGKPCHIPPME